MCWHGSKQTAWRNGAWFVPIAQKLLNKLHHMMHEYGKLVKAVVRAVSKMSYSLIDLYQDFTKLLFFGDSGFRKISVNMDRLSIDETSVDLSFESTWKYLTLLLSSG